MTRDRTKASSPKVSDSSSSKNPSEPALDRAIQSRIGDQLRAMYDQLAEQPVPDRFLELLGQLDKGSGDKGGKR